MADIDSAIKVRVLLAQAIFSRPEVLLLDEPTNNLDIETIAWLEKFLADYEGCIAVVSHDRHFLNRVCTHICDVDFRTIRTFVGNWDVYAAAEQLARAQRSKETARVEKQLEKLKSFVERFKSNAARSRQATSRQKQIDQMSGQRIVPSIPRRIRALCSSSSEPPVKTSLKQRKSLSATKPTKRSLKIFPCASTR